MWFKFLCINTFENRRLIMMEILKKAGLATGISTVLVLAVTFLPIYYQFTDMGKVKAELVTIKAQLAELKAK